MGQILRQIKSGGKQKYKVLYLAMLLIGFLLLLRDTFDVSVNKYIFLAIIGVTTFTLSIDRVLYLIAFIMPLYVGIPGNYMTLIFLIRFLMESKRAKIDKYNWIFCILAGGYAFVNAVATNSTEIAQLAFFPSMVLVMLIYSLDVPYNKDRLVLCYSMGVAALGLIMLISTLQVYDFVDLLTSSTRLGDDSMHFAEEGIMNVSIDPNFYGMFAITAISTGVEVLSGHESALSGSERSLMLVAVGSSLVVALIGLSRAFFMVLCVWGVLYALSRKKIKSLLPFIIAVIVAGVAIYLFIPDVLEAIFERLGEDNVADGGGRVSMIKRYFLDWSQNAQSILFGIGIFECDVHCTPLQALFGGGLAFMVLFAGFVVTLGKKNISVKNKSLLRSWLPMIVTVAMALTVPALMVLHCMYPIILAGQYKMEGYN